MLIGIKYINKGILFIFLILLAGCSTGKEIPCANITNQSSITPVSIEVNEVFIPQDIINKLNNLFETETMEFQECLYGYTNGSTIIINYSYSPEMFNRSKGGVSAYCNNKDFKGTIHSHPLPFRNCALSNGDKTASNITGEEISGVICDINIINIETKNKRLKVNNIILNNSYIQVNCCGEPLICKPCEDPSYIFSCTNNIGKCIPP